MDQEKEMTQIVSSAGEYLVPKVKVVEIKARRVICLSDNTSTKNAFDEMGD